MKKKNIILIAFFIFSTLGTIKSQNNSCIVQCGDTIAQFTPPIDSIIGENLEVLVSHVMVDSCNSNTSYVQDTIVADFDTCGISVTLSYQGFNSCAHQGSDGGYCVNIDELDPEDIQWTDTFMINSPFAHHLDIVGSNVTLTKLKMRVKFESIALNNTPNNPPDSLGIGILKNNALVEIITKYVPTDQYVTITYDLNTLGLAATDSIQVQILPFHNTNTANIANIVEIFDAKVYGICGELCDPIVWGDPMQTYVDNCTPFDDVLFTFYGEDNCGNTAEYSKIVHVVDTIDPVINCQEMATIYCDEDEPNLLEDAYDLCTNIDVVNDTITQVYPCKTVKLITYTVTDECDNSSSCMAQVTILNKVPEITPPPNMSISCEDIINEEAPVSLTGEPTIDDICYGDIEVTYTDNYPGGVCYTIVRTWVIDIHCIDSLITYQQEINVIDDIPPSITCNMDTQACDDDGIPVPSVIATDNCDPNPILTEGSPIFMDDSCLGYYSIIFTATDACGNTSTCEYTRDIVDTQAPVFTDLDPISAECGNHQFDTPIVSDNCGFDYTYVDDVVGTTCAGSIVTRTWTAIDSCGNTSSISQTSTAVDNIAPELTCVPTDLTTYTDDTTCKFEFPIPEIVVNDNCDQNPSIIAYIDGNSYSIGDMYTGVGMQDVMIDYVVTDACGNIGECSMTVHVIENPVAMLICKTETVVIQDTCVLLDPSFLIQEYISCCSEYSLMVSRDSISYSTDLELCCSDAGEVEVWIQVTNTCTDAIYTCKGVVQVINQSIPMVSCPSDKSVVCDEPIIFDELVLEYDNDCLHVTVDSTFSNTNNGCLEEYTKTWTVTYGPGVDVNTIICSQTIYEVSSLECDMIDWPRDTILHGCDPVIPNLLPVMPLDTCLHTQYAMIHEFEIPDTLESTICKRIFREWRVDDYCVGNTKMSIKTCTHTQVITVMNQQMPLVNIQDSILVGANNDCKGIFTVPEYDIQTPCYNYPGLEVVSVIDGITVESGDQIELGLGCHTLWVDITPECGLPKQEIIKVCVQDMLAPECGLVSLTTSLNDDCWIITCAEQFDFISEDNCTDSENLMFSFIDTTLDACQEFNCFDRGENFLQIVITDEAGNSTLCATTLIIQDNSNGCDSMWRTMHGNVLACDGRDMEHVQVRSLAGGIQTGFSETDSDGTFTVTTGMQPNTVLEASLEDEAIRGVSTLDLVLIQKHLLEMQLLTDPYKLVAADVNNDGKISAIDLIELRKLILGVYTDFPNNDVWRFVDVNSSINQNNLSDIDTQIEVPNEATTNGLTFVGIKTGDVNGSAQVNTSETVDNRSSLRAEIVSMKFIDQQLILVFDQEVLAAQIAFTTDDNTNLGSYTASHARLNQHQLRIISTPEQASQVHMIDISKFPVKSISTLKWRLKEDQWTHGYTKEQEQLSLSLRESVPQALHIYPNPSSNALYVAGDNAYSEYKIIDLQGVAISAGNLHIDRTIDIKHLTNGMYILVMSKDRIEYTTTFIKM